MGARVAVAGVAVLALVWLGVLERDTRLVAEGTGAAQARNPGRAEDAFRDALLLNPDSTPDLRRAFVSQGSGRSPEAVAVLRKVLSREPDNLDAWGLLYAFTRDRDPAAARRALAERARLDPLGAARSSR
jgi:Flp pilus assembly protein TadD